MSSSAADAAHRVTHSRARCCEIRILWFSFVAFFIIAQLPSPSFATNVNAPSKPTYYNANLEEYLKNRTQLDLGFLEKISNLVSEGFRPLGDVSVGLVAWQAKGKSDKRAVLREAILDEILPTAEDFASPSSNKIDRKMLFFRAYENRFKRFSPDEDPKELALKQIKELAAQAAKKALEIFGNDQHFLFTNLTNLQTIVSDTLITEYVRIEFQNTFPQGPVPTEIQLDHMLFHLRTCFQKLGGTDSGDEVTACITRFQEEAPFHVGREMFLSQFEFYTTLGQRPVFDLRKPSNLQTLRRAEEQGLKTYDQCAWEWYFKNLKLNSKATSNAQLRNYAQSCVYSAVLGAVLSTTHHKITSEVQSLGGTQEHIQDLVSQTRQCFFDQGLLAMLAGKLLHPNYSELGNLEPDMFQKVLNRCLNPLKESAIKTLVPIAVQNNADLNQALVDSGFDQKTKTLISQNIIQTIESSSLKRCLEILHSIPDSGQFDPERCQSIISFEAKIETLGVILEKAAEIPEIQKPIRETLQACKAVQIEGFLEKLKDPNVDLPETDLEAISCAIEVIPLAFRLILDKKLDDPGIPREIKIFTIHNIIQELSALLENVTTLDTLGKLTSTFSKQTPWKVFQLIAEKILQNELSDDKLGQKAILEAVITLEFKKQIEATTDDNAIDGLIRPAKNQLIILIATHRIDSTLLSLLRNEATRTAIRNRALKSLKACLRIEPPDPDPKYLKKHPGRLDNCIFNLKIDLALEIAKAAIY